MFYLYMFCVPGCRSTQGVRKVRKMCARCARCASTTGVVSGADRHPGGRDIRREVLPGFEVGNSESDVDVVGVLPGPPAGVVRSLRVKPVRGASGLLEMTWAFASPDGRATFELVTVDGELRCRWRCIGEHVAFKAP